MGNVVKIYRENNVQKRNSRVMSRKKKSEEKKQNVQSEQTQDVSGNKKNGEKGGVSEFIKNSGVSVLVGVLVLVVWGTIHDLPENVSGLKTDISVINYRLEALEGNYTILNSQVWSINRANSNQEESAEEVEPVILLASSEFSAGMIREQQSTDEDKKEVIVDMEKFEDSAVIGENVQSSEEVTKESIENKPFIMHYKEKGEDVFFFGKYNENSQWDGKCIINRYKDSKLTFIMEVEYDHGELIKYQQVFRGKNSLGQEIWYVSDREVEGEKNSGNTTTYFFYGDCEKDFDIHTIEEADMMSVEKFLKTIPSTIEGFYSGYTSDGSYNDDSGDAYLVKYKPDGSVRYLYKGKMKNGEANDDTGNAWEFSWGFANDGFHYHKGVFKDGEPMNTTDEWNYPVEPEFIASKINLDDYDCPLTGLID